MSKARKLDLSQCALCTADIGEDWYELDTPVRLHEKLVYPRFCIECAETHIYMYFCEECDEAYVPVASWVKIVSGTTGSSRWCCPCQKHSLSKTKPTSPCDVKGCTTEVVHPVSRTARRRLYCTKHRLSAVRCPAQYCRAIIHPGDEEVSVLRDDEVHWCRQCYIRVLPDWFPVSSPDKWNYSPECTCVACVWLSEQGAEPWQPGVRGPAVTQCTHCKVTHSTETIITTEDGDYCHACHHRGFSMCDKCGKKRHRSKFLPSILGLVCDECNMAAGLWLCKIQCQSWYKKGHECRCGGLYAYNYTPTNPPFLSLKSETTPRDETLYVGIELEVEAINDKATRRVGSNLILEHAKDWAYPVHDGSLRGDRGDGTGGQYGFEVVTYPMTYGWFTENWETISSLLTSLSAAGFRSWERERCGMHIHVSRAPMNEGHQMKLLQFIYNNMDLAMCIGQRGPTSLGIRRFASFTAEDRAQMIRKVRDYVNPGVGSHHVAVNSMRPSTLEARWFRGTLNPDSFRKNIEFMVALWHFTRRFGLQSANQVNFIEWLRKPPECSNYSFLLDFLEKNFITKSGSSRSTTKARKKATRTRRAR